MAGLTSSRAYRLLWTATIQSIANAWIGSTHPRVSSLRQRHQPASSTYLHHTSCVEQQQRDHNKLASLGKSQWWYDFQHDKDPYEGCWSADSLSVNPQKTEDINRILQGLRSPAPQSFYIIQRGLVQSRSQQRQTDALDQRIPVLQQCGYLLKDGWEFGIRGDETDVEPGVDWTVLATDDNNNDRSDWTFLSCEENVKIMSSLQISHKILEVVTMASAHHAPVPKLDDLLTQLHNRLELTLGTDIRGRSSADTAFNLAMSGIIDSRAEKDDIYFKLLQTAYQELQRTSGRNSRKARDVVLIVEKLAASGMRGRDLRKLDELIPKMKSVKDSDFDVLQQLRGNSQEFSLLSPRPLKCLWRFSARQAKIREQTMASPSKVSSVGDGLAPQPQAVYDRGWMGRLNDTSRPLVIDIGCGFGTSLIGLASQTSANSRIPIDFDKCNFVGGDLSQLLIRFGQGISKRWKLHQRLQFCYMPADDLLEQIEREYQGPIAMVLIQFPSPYRLLDEGNSQLPTGPDDPSFMVTKELMGRVVRLLSKSSQSAGLLIQSNCEDVAVTIRNLGLEHGLVPVDADHPILSESNQAPPSKRTLRWIEAGGGPRATGREWSAGPLLPVGCRTETEIAYEIDQKPIHRCWMRSAGSSSQK